MAKATKCPECGGEVASDCFDNCDCVLGGLQRGSLKHIPTLPLHDENESDTFYYYLRDKSGLSIKDKKKKGRPVITVCLIADKNRRTIVRGVSICSVRDNPCKEKGRRIAHGRAMWAATNPSRSNPIARKEARTVLFRVGIFSSSMDKASYVSLNDLTIKEKNILFPIGHVFHKDK